MSVQKVILDLVRWKNEGPKILLGIGPISLVGRAEVAIRQAKNIRKSIVGGILGERSDPVIAPADKESDIRVVPDSREVFPCQTILNPQINRGRVKRLSRDIAGHGRSDSTARGFKASPTPSAGIVGGHEEMPLVRFRLVENLRRVGRDNKLSSRLKLHQRPNDEPVPLRIEMQFGLVNEDDPRLILVQRQSA